jgi:AbrB family looped-hinge helix DNA binding protein
MLVTRLVLLPMTRSRFCAERHVARDTGRWYSWLMPGNQTIRQPVNLRTETSRVGKRGAIVVPARMRKKFGIQEGSLVIAEERDDGILIRPAVAVPVEIYTPERVAEFLLSNAVDATDYAKAVRAVRKLGIDPRTVAHHRPRR